MHSLIAEGVGSITGQLAETHKAGEASFKGVSLLHVAAYTWLRVCGIFRRCAERVVIFFLMIPLGFNT